MGYGKWSFKIASFKHKLKKKWQRTTGGLAQAGAWLVRHLSVEQPLSALVQAVVIPPPAPSRWDVRCKPFATLSGDFDSAQLDSAAKK